MTPGRVSFAEVKTAAGMRLVLEDYGVLEKPRRSGREQYRGRCPIHGGEGRDAFHARLGKNVFHCFACGAGGNVLDWWRSWSGARRGKRRSDCSDGMWRAGRQRRRGSRSREKGNRLRKKERGIRRFPFLSQAWLPRTPMFPGAD